MSPRSSVDEYKSSGNWVALVVIVMLRAFMLMLALGILHQQWTAGIPALGLWECLVLSFAFTLVKR